MPPLPVSTIGPFRDEFRRRALSKGAPMLHSRSGTSGLHLLCHNAWPIPGEVIKLYRKGQKSDFRDAEAIADAVQPNHEVRRHSSSRSNRLDLQPPLRLRAAGRPAYRHHQPDPSLPAGSRHCGPAWATAPSLLPLDPGSGRGCRSGATHGDKGSIPDLSIQSRRREGVVTKNLTPKLKNAATIRCQREPEIRSAVRVSSRV